MTSWSVALGPYASSLVKVVPPSRAHYQAEVGAWSGTARFDNMFDGYEGFGYVTGLDAPDAGVSVCVSVQTSGRYRLICRVANATGSRSTLTATAADPNDGSVHSTTKISVPTTSTWTAWQEVGVILRLAPGENLITLVHGTDDQGSVNVDHFALQGA